jgi:hypothetical protein
MGNDRASRPVRLKGKPMGGLVEAWNYAERS